MRSHSDITKILKEAVQSYSGVFIECDRTEESIQNKYILDAFVLGLNLYQEKVMVKSKCFLFEKDKLNLIIGNGDACSSYHFLAILDLSITNLVFDINSCFPLQKEKKIIMLFDLL